jgi:membrane protein DedA with SNARE-associated domain
MHNIMQLLIEHGYVALFVAVLAEQFGLPVPAAPFLIAAGALAGLDRLSPAWALAIATSASLISDYTWFHLGKSEGSFILNWLGKRCPEPQSCAVKVQSTYSRYGPRSILVSKFVPVLNILAPQLAGTFRLAPWKFFALDTTAVLLWTSAYMAVGWVFRTELESVGPLLQRVGVFLALALIIAVTASILQRIGRASARHLAASNSPAPALSTHQ